MIDGNGTATVELSFQGDDQLQVCVTPLVIASYELDQPTLGGAAKLVDHTVVSSEDLDDWLLTGDPHTVTVDVEGCYHAVVVFWDVAIPLDLDGVSDPSHLLALRTGGDGCGSPGGGGRLPDTGTEAMRLVGLAAALVATGLTVVLLAHRRRVVV